MLILDRRHHQGKAQKCRKVLVASPSPPHQPSPPCNVYGRYLQGVFRGGQAVLRRFLRALVERGCTQGYGCLLGLGRGAQYVGYIFVTFHSTFTTLDIISPLALRPIQIVFFMDLPLHSFRLWPLRRCTLLLPASFVWCFRLTSYQRERWRYLLYTFIYLYKLLYTFI